MKKYIKYIPLLFAAALLAGCLKDSTADVPGVGDGFIEVELGLEIEDEGQSLTRAGLTWNQENEIETLDLLVFEHDESAAGRGLFRYSTHGYDIKNTNGSRAKTYKAMLATEYYNTGGVKTSLIDKRIFIVVLANSRQVWDAQKSSVTAASTFTDVMAKLVFDASDNWDTATPRYLPMASHGGANFELMTYDIKGSQFWANTLLRSVAAVDIGFYNGGGETPQAFADFTPQKVYLCNSNDRGLLSEQTAAATTVLNKVRIPSTASLTERVYEFSSASGIFNEIYIPESEAVASDSDQRPYLLIMGQYNNAESWYKVEFPQDSQYPSKATAVYRNWRYVFKIYGIAGQGYGSKEEAISGEGKDPKLWMNLTVVPFSQRTVPAELDGPYIFDVSQTEFYLDDYGRYNNYDYDDNVLELSTDYSGGWRVDDVTYEVDPGSQFWLRTDIIKGVPFEQGQLWILTDDNYTGNGRIGWIHLSAGRWKYKIKVQQGEIIPLSVTPASRTISFWSHRNGPTPQNTFTVEGAGTDWDYEVSYLTAWEGGLTVHKTDDGQGFYVQCDRNDDDAPRRANVTITSGSRSVTVPVTQDWADCGIGGNVAYADFGGTPVKTHLFGGNAYRALILSLDNICATSFGENWREWLQDYPDLWQLYEDACEEWSKNIPDKEYYACWMLENSTYGTPDVVYFGGDIGGSEKIGPYYSYENAPNACPEGWKLPEFFELVAIANMGVMLELAEPGSDEMLAVDLWKSQPGAFPGGYHKYESENYEWQGWGEQGFFHTTWNGIYHLNPETQYNADAPIALYLGLEPFIQGNLTIDVPGPMGADSKFAVRCVKEKTYSYE